MITIITIKVVSSNPVYGEVYSIQQYVIKVVNDLRQVCGFLRELRLPPPIKLTAMISQQYCWKWRLTPGNQTKSWYTYFRKMSIQGSSLDNFQIHSINYCLVSYFNRIELTILHFRVDAVNLRLIVSIICLLQMTVIVYFCNVKQLLKRTDISEEK